ncbi:hypothetical protein OF83DRAFT_375375 [Amylostereum chailletii]|nr:hypothetical protein OF83DRAFT_375375 [Amylostereum chailletii]
MSVALSTYSQDTQENPYLDAAFDSGREVIGGYIKEFLGNIWNKQLPSHKKKNADMKLDATLTLMETFISKLEHEDKKTMQNAYMRARRKQKQTVEGSFDFFFAAHGYHKVSNRVFALAKSYSDKVREAALWDQITASSLSSELYSYTNSESDQVSMVTSEVFSNQDNTDVVAVLTATTDAGNNTTFIAELHYDHEGNSMDATAAPEMNFSVDMDISDANISGGDTDGGDGE